MDVSPYYHAYTNNYKVNFGVPCFLRERCSN